MGSVGGWLPQCFNFLNASDTYMNGGYDTSEEEMTSLNQLHSRTFFVLSLHGQMIKRRKLLIPAAAR